MTGQSDTTAGPPEIAALIRSLGDPDKKTVRSAADALVSLARGQPELARRLEELLSQAPPAERWPFAYVLGHIGSPSLQCLQALQETLGSRDPDLRWAAGSLLTHLGKRDARVLDLLLALLKTGTSTQRRMAVYGLRDLELKDGAVLAALDDSDVLVRVAAVLSLKLHSDTPQAGLDLLLDLLLKDPDTRVRCAAAFALGGLGTPSGEICAALTKAAEGPDPQLRKAAEAALDLLKKKGPPSPR